MAGKTYNRHFSVSAAFTAFFILAVASLAIHAQQIPYAPTSEGEIPEAILGKAGAPRGGDLAYFEEDQATRGYLAEPEGPGPRGAVILIHEWNGLVDRVRQVADALAAEGYVALAADLYSGRTGSNRDENMALVRETLDDPDTIIRNLDAAAAYLRSRPDVNGKIGAMGWCYGGGVARATPWEARTMTPPPSSTDACSTIPKGSAPYTTRFTAPSPDSTAVLRPSRWNALSPRSGRPAWRTTCTSTTTSTTDSGCTWTATRKTRNPPWTPGSG